MKAVIYAHYSSDSQREESIEGQLRECTEYAERNGINILRSYIDRATRISKYDKGQRAKAVRCGADMETRPFFP